MKMISRLALTALVLALVFAVPALAQQGQGQQQPPPKQPGQTQTPPAGQQPPAAPAAPPVNPEEQKAFDEFAKLPPSDVEGAIQKGGDFLKKYPESRYQEWVEARLTSVYLTKGDAVNVLTFGQKTLELNPDHLDVLAIMAYTMSRATNPGALDAAQKYEKAEQYAKRALQQIETMPKPESLTEEDFTKAKNEKIFLCRSGLGLSYFRRQRFADAATEFEQSTKVVPNPDPTDFFILGISYQQIKRFSDAATAFEKCSVMPSGLQPNCKQAMEEAKKQAATSLQPPKQ